MQLVSDVRARSQRRLTVILIHHENKGGKVSGAWEGSGDTLLHVQAAGNGHTIVHVQKARWDSATHGTTLKLAWTAGEKAVLGILEGDPDAFEERTGDDARALGRNPNAHLWGLRQGSSAHDADPLFLRRPRVARERLRLRSPLRTQTLPTLTPSVGRSLRQRPSAEMADRGLGAAVRTAASPPATAAARAAGGNSTTTAARPERSSREARDRARPLVAGAATHRAGPRDPHPRRGVTCLIATKA